MRNLSHDLILREQANLSSAPWLNQAVNDGIIRVTSLKGISLELAAIELVVLKDQPKQVTIPLGMTLVSTGNHQTMTVRKNHVLALDKSPLEVKIPVTCIEYQKAVPQTTDIFAELGEATPLVKAVLSIASAAEKQAIWNEIPEYSNWRSPQLTRYIPKEERRLGARSAFVTQLAIWQVTDGTDPHEVLLAPAFLPPHILQEARQKSGDDPFFTNVVDSMIKKATELEAQLSKEIVKRAKEFLEQTHSD